MNVVVGDRTSRIRSVKISSTSSPNGGLRTAFTFLCPLLLNDWHFWMQKDSIQLTEMGSYWSPISISRILTFCLLFPHCLDRT